MPPRQPSFLTAAAVLAIQVYRNILSYIMLPSCRFFPSCSEYALEALQRHGFWRGGWQTIGRILRCHPLARGGVDPVRSR